MPGVLIVGIDGASFDLMAPWIQDGTLPTLDGLLRRGVSALLRSVPSQNSASAWSSFATGMRPGMHGIFGFTERVPGTYGRRPVNAGIRVGPTFWSLLSQAGHRVGVVNVPLSYPAEVVDGFLIAGLDTPGIDSPGVAYPPGLGRELRQRRDAYIIEPGIPGLIKAGRRQAALGRILLALENRLAWTLELQRRYRPDLLIVVFTASDCAGHFFWGDMDPTYPFRSGCEEECLEDVLRTVYGRLDGAIAALVEAMEPEVTLVVSDHGSGFNQRGAEYLRPWLTELGLLTWREHGGIMSSVAKLLHGFVDRSLGREAKLRLSRRLPGLRVSAEEMMTFGEVDWSTTRVYCTGTTDELYINLRGREPRGIVEPGTEYDVLCKSVIRLLREVTDPATGRPATESVVHRDEVYDGPFVDRAPDIIIRWSTTGVLSGLRSPGHRSVPIDPPPPPFQSGGHRLHGVFIAEGAHLKSGERVGALSIEDVAPTVMHLLGEPVPENWKGRVATSVFEERWLRSEPVRKGAPVEQLPRSGEWSYDEREADLVEERLRGLGYVE